MFFFALVKLYVDDIYYFLIFNNEQKKKEKRRQQQQLIIGKSASAVKLKTVFEIFEFETECASKQQLIIQANIAIIVHVFILTSQANRI